MQFARIYKDIISLILLGGGVIGLPTFLWATADAVLPHLVDVSSTTWNGYGKFLFAIVIPIILTLLIVLIRELLRVSKEGKEEIETAQQKELQLKEQYEAELQSLKDQHQAELQTLNDQHGIDLNDLNMQHSAELKKLEESTDKELQQLNSDVRKFQEHVRKYLTYLKKIIELLHTVEIETAIQEHVKDLQALSDQHSVELKNLEESTDKELQQLNSDVRKFQGHVGKFLTVSKKTIELLHPEQEVENRAVYKDFSYEIETAANGDTKVTENFTLIVGQEPVNWIKNEIFSDAESTPIEWHDEIGLNVRVKNLDTNEIHKAEILPTEMKENEFCYSVVFLPRLFPNSRYEVIVSYLWPGLSAKIVQDTWIDWNIVKERLEQGTEIRISAEFDSALGVLKPDITVSKGVDLKIEPYPEARNSRHVFSGAVISKEEIQVGIKFEKTNP